MQRCWQSCMKVQMKKTTTKEEMVDPAKGITEMRMALGHLCQLQAALVEHPGMGDIPELLTTIPKLADEIRNQCIDLINRGNE